jgi:hypothetical protein
MMAVCNMVKFLNVYTGEQISASLSVCSCAKCRHTIPLERGLLDNMFSTRIIVFLLE